MMTTELVGFLDGSTTLDIGGERPPGWWARQRLSVDYYRDAHAAHGVDPTEAPVYAMFGALINSAAFNTGADKPVVLDVGCGIFRERSPAFARLSPRCRYVGLDPLPENLERTYPFICGRLEDLAQRADFAGQVHVFSFGTALDHIEDLNVAARAVKKLAAPNARAVFWNGLSDPDRVIRSNGAAVFQRLAEYRSRTLAMAAYAGYGLLRLPRVLRAIKQQGTKLAHRQPLDGSHYRWFTEQTTTALLSLFGEIEENVTLPNTHHSLVTVRI